MQRLILTFELNKGNQWYLHVHPRSGGKIVTQDAYLTFLKSPSCRAWKTERRNEIKVR